MYFLLKATTWSPHGVHAANCWHVGQGGGGGSLNQTASSRTPFINANLIDSLRAVSWAGVACPSPVRSAWPHPRRLIRIEIARYLIGHNPCNLPFERCRQR